MFRTVGDEGPPLRIRQKRRLAGLRGAMKVSVVVRAFNRGYIIGEAIESILAQTYPEFEILVVDDASTDDTCAMVGRFADPRVRLVRRTKNGGHGAALNTGLAQSRGDLISILDSDDLWKPNKLECEVALLEKHREVDAVFTDLEKRDGDIYMPSFMRETPAFSALLAKQSFPEGLIFTQREMYLCMLREGMPIKPSALTLRREAVERTGPLNVDWPAGSDREYMIRFTRVHRVAYIDQALAVLRVLGDAAHRVPARYEANKLLVINFLQEEKRRLKNDREALAAANHGIFDASRYLAWHYEDQGRRGDAAKALFRGFGRTRDPELLVRAAFACLPGSLISMFRTLVGRKSVPSRVN